MELDISWEETSVSQVEQTEITEILSRAIYECLLSMNEQEDAEIGLVMVDDRTIHNLNKTYRGVDRPTDVLSFSMREQGEGEPQIFLEDLMAYEALQEGEQFGDPDSSLGDIVISVERARAQAQEYGHSLMREIVYLAVHGAFHLLGFDHSEEGKETVMRGMEEKVMEKLGLTR